jgi:hypothetical protein
MSKFDDFTSAAPTAADFLVGYAAGGGAGSDRRFLSAAITPVKYANSNSDQANSLAHLAGVQVGDQFSAKWFDTNKQYCSHGRWYCYAVSGSTTPGTIGNGGSTTGITMEGTGGAKFALVPEYSGIVDIRAAGITCDGITSGQEATFALLAAAAKARGLKLVNGRLQPMRITNNKTIDLDYFDCDLTFQAGTPAERTISAITKANPGVVTSASHGFANGQTVKLYSAAGMTEVNGNSYTVANVTTDTFELSGTDTSGFGTYTGGAKAQVVGRGDFYSGVGTNLQVTFTNANPGVATTASNHGLSAGDTVLFGVAGTGCLPPNVSPLTTYYVLATGLTATSFQFATSAGGTAINTTVTGNANAGTGTMYCYIAPVAVSGLQTKDIVQWDGKINRLAIAVRAAFSPGVSNGQTQKVTIKGDGGFDFTTQSTVIGNYSDIPTIARIPIWNFRAAYCYVGVGLAGPFEKKQVEIKATYCQHLSYNLNNSSADTVETRISTRRSFMQPTQKPMVSARP